MLTPLRRAPGFTIAAIASIAIGVGVLSAVLPPYDSILRGDRTYRRDARLVSIGGTMRQETTVDWPIGYADLDEIRRGARSIDAVAGVSSARSFNLRSDDRIDHVDGQLVSAEYFQILGLTPTLGRFFTAEEEVAPGARPVVVLSHELWSTMFGSDRSIVGRTLTLNDRGYTVIGVGPPRFNGLSDGAALWAPLGIARDVYNVGYTDMRQFRWLAGIVRARPGATVQQVQSDLDRLARDLEARFPVENKGLGFAAEELEEAYLGEVRKPLGLLALGAAVLVLVVVVNFTTLLLMRATSREREAAIRTALGASPRQVVGIFAAEAALLAVAGTALGVVLGWAAQGLLRGTGGIELPSYVEVAFTARTAAAVAACLVVLVACGVAASAMMFGRPMADGLRSSSRGDSLSRGGRLVFGVLTATEAALAVLLLVCAGLLTRNVQRIVRADLGFRPERMVAARIDLTGERYAQNPTVWALSERLLERARGIPGVRGAALEGPGLPLSGSYGVHFRREDEPETVETTMGNRHHVTPGYFDVMGVRLLGGRDFAASDRDGAEKVVVMSEAMSKRAFPDGQAVGRRIVTQNASGKTFWTVIGVVADVRFAGYGDASSFQPDIYFPFLQSAPRNPALMSLVVRTDGDPTALLAALRPIMRELDPALPLYDTRTMRERLDDQTARDRFLVKLMSVLGACTLLLATVGLYGVVAFATMRAQREMGIRAALGASHGHIARHTYRQHLAPVAVGVLAGMLAATWAGKALGAAVEGLTVNEPAVFAVAAVVALGAATAACVRPVRRLAGTDPKVALSSE